MNAFEQIAADAEAERLAKKARRRVVTSERDAPMVPKGMEKQLYEQSAQFRLYEKWLRDRRQRVLEVMPELAALLRDLTPDSADAFVVYFTTHEWGGFDRGELHDILSVVGDAIVKMRIQHGLSPMDDSLPGEAPTAFEIIRNVLTGVGNHG